MSLICYMTVGSALEERLYDRDNASVGHRLSRLLYCQVGHSNETQGHIPSVGYVDRATRHAVQTLQVLLPWTL